MASKVPVVKQVAWASLIPHLGVLTILCLASYWGGVVDVRRALLTGLGLYWLLVIAIKMLGATDHRKGMRLVRQEKFLEAIPHFDASYLHFTKKAWVDKYRYLTMLSSSAMCYREMALCNIAFCYGQSGNGAKALQYYTQVLQEYPDNGLARAAMRLRESMREVPNNP
jgi:tetratricopeptide (TPR) repeat protein